MNVHRHDDMDIILVEDIVEDNVNAALHADAEMLFLNSETNEDDHTRSTDPEQRSNDDTGTNTAPASNTRHATHSYTCTLAHSMDNPASSQSYDAQMLHQTAVDDFDSTGSTVKVNRYITGFLMNQMTAIKGIKKHEQLTMHA